MVASHKTIAQAPLASGIFGAAPKEPGRGWDPIIPDPVPASPGPDPPLAPIPPPMLPCNGNYPTERTGVSFFGDLGDSRKPSASRVFSCITDSQPYGYHAHTKEPGKAQVRKTTPNPLHFGYFPLTRDRTTFMALSPESDDQQCAARRAWRKAMQTKVATVTGQQGEAPTGTTSAGVGAKEARGRKRSRQTPGRHVEKGEKISPLAPLPLAELPPGFDFVASMSDGHTASTTTTTPRPCVSCSISRRRNSSPRRMALTRQRARAPKRWAAWLTRLRNAIKEIFKPYIE